MLTLLLQAKAATDWLSLLFENTRESVVTSVQNMVTGLAGRLPFLIASLLVILFFWYLAKLVKWIFLVATKRAPIDQRLRLLTGRMLLVTIITVGFLTGLTVLIPSFSFASLITGLGFSSFVIGFATKDILNNFLSGILILWQRPFHIGDYIFIGKDQGMVEYIGVRATSLRKDDGELVLIPNGDMYSSALTIRGKGTKRRMSLTFCVSYDEPLEPVKATARSALRTTNGVVSDPPPNVLVADYAPEGVKIAANFWINTHESKPLEVFDRAAVGVARNLRAAGVSVYPADPIVVQRAEEPGVEPDLESKRKELL